MPRPRDARLDPLFRAVVEAIGDPVWAVSAAHDDPRIVFANDAFLRATGYSREEILGADPALIAGPETEIEASSAVRQAIETKQPASAEFLAYAKDGQSFWLDLTLIPLRDEAGAVSHVAAIGRDISGMKWFENLRERELTFQQALLDAIPIPVFFKDLDGRYLGCNKAFVSFTGMPRSDIIGRTVDAVSSSGNIERYHAEDAYVRETGLTLRSEAKVSTRGGTHADVIIQRAVFRAPDDGIAGTIGAILDITDIRQAEQRLRDAVESLNDGFAMFDADDRLVLCNRPYLETYRHFAGLGDLVGMTFEGIIRDAIANGDVADPLALADPEAWVAWRLERHRNPPEEPYEQQLHDGRWLLVSERRLADGGYAGVRTDITALKRAEARLSGAIEGIDAGVVLWDAEDRLVLCNSRFRDLYPKVGHLYRPGAVFEDLVRTVAAAGQYALDISIEEWCAQRMASHRDLAGPIEHRLSDGRWVLTSERRTPDGGTVSVRTDITKLKHQEQQLRENEERLNRVIAELQDSRTHLEAQAEEVTTLMREINEQRLKAEAANMAKSQFLATMSHELRTPLNAILGFSEIISRELLGECNVPRYVNYAGDVHDSAQHLLQLINDVLDMSKIEAGRYELQWQYVDLNAEVEYCLRLVEGRANEIGVGLEAVRGEGVERVYADRRAVRQILLNLLSNAIKFTAQNGTVRVEAGRAEKGGYCEITVQDTGIGIPKRALNRLGYPFEVVDERVSRAKGGSGLGLALSKALVDLHHGEMLIRSKIDVGTSVTVRLPISSPAMHGGEPSGPIRGRPAALVRSRPGKVRQASAARKKVRPRKKT